VVKRKPAAGYLRVSTAREGMSAPDIYRAEIKQYADAYDYRVTYYEDIDYTGRTQARPGFQRMLDERRKFELIIVPKLSRFGRNMKQNLETYDLLEEDDIDLAFLDLRVDTSTGAGRLMRNMMTAMAEYESDLISERWKDVHRYLRSQGRPVGGTSTPYGYRYEKEAKTYEIHEDEAEVVREVYESYLQGESLRAITDDLNERGVLTGQRGAKTWLHQTVSGMLENPAYAGILRHKDGDTEGSWEAIIPKGSWQRAYDLRQVTKEEVRKTRKPAAGSGKYLLSGLIVCGACGKNLHHRPKAGHRPEVYGCPDSSRGPGSCPGGTVAAGRAETFVLEAFMNRLRSGKVERPEKLTKGKRRGPDYEARLKDIERKMQRLVDLSLAAEGPLAEKTFQQKATALEDEREAILREQQKQVVETAEAEIRIEEMGRFLGDLAHAVPELWDEGALPEDAVERYESVLDMHVTDVAQRRALLKTLISKVRTVPGTRPKKVRVVWR
jgi:site-specific DNA recombinase